MSTVAATNASDSNALLSLLRSNTPAAVDTATPGSADTSTRSGADPATVVDLSDRAKALLARAKTEQTAADKLAAQLRAGKDPDDRDVEQNSDSDRSSLFDKLTGRKARAASDTDWQAGSKWGDASISDAEFTAKYKDALLGSLVGLPPEKQAALQAAINNGTLEFQKGSDVDGYNTRTVVTYSNGPGGGQGMSTSGYRAPTGAVKDAIDAGNAIAFWTEDRGDVYVTW